MEKKYYLPISSKCLAHYFGSACIMPSKYFQNRPTDLQDKFVNFILLTNCVGTNETDCCLELLLIENELKELINIKENFYLYQKPLPISRVKKVFFSDKLQMEQTIANINLSTAFVPNRLIELISEFDSVEASGLEIPNNIRLKDWTVEIRKYNSFLGGFALMRLAGEEYMNYSDNYFSTLSFFNEVIKNELLVADRNIDNRFFDAFIGESSFKKLFPIINKDIDENDLYKIAEEERQNIVKDNITRIIDLNNLEKATYIIAVLNSFGVGNEAKKKKIDSLILSNFKSEIKPEKSEVVALCYGLNKGYSIFANKYKSANKEKIVKFQLNSQVDYYTIESLFQFVFNNTKAQDLSYLDNWCQKSNEKHTVTNKSDYQVLDVLVIGKKKPKISSSEYLANLLQRFFQKENEILFKDFFDKIRTIIYNDTLEETNSEIEIRNDEINRLNKENDKIHKLENELNRLINEKQSVKSKDSTAHYKQPSTNKNVVEEPKIEPLYIDKRLLIKQVLQYKEKNKTMLEKEAKEKGIFIPKGTKLDDIIVLLMTSPNNPFDTKIQFPE